MLFQTFYVSLRSQSANLFRLGKNEYENEINSNITITLP